MFVPLGDGPFVTEGPLGLVEINDTNYHNMKKSIFWVYKSL